MTAGFCLFCGAFYTHAHVACCEDATAPEANMDSKIYRPPTRTVTTAIGLGSIDNITIFMSLKFYKNKS